MMATLLPLQLPTPQPPHNTGRPQVSKSSWLRCWNQGPVNPGGGLNPSLTVDPSHQKTWCQWNIQVSCPFGTIPLPCQGACPKPTRGAAGCGRCGRLLLDQCAHTPDAEAPARDAGLGASQRSGAPSLSRSVVPPAQGLSSAPHVCLSHLHKLPPAPVTRCHEGVRCCLSQDKSSQGCHQC